MNTNTYVAEKHDSLKRARIEAISSLKSDMDLHGELLEKRIKTMISDLKTYLVEKINEAEEPALNALEDSGQELESLKCKLDRMRSVLLGFSSNFAQYAVKYGGNENTDTNIQIDKSIKHLVVPANSKALASELEDFPAKEKTMKPKSFKFCGSK